MIVIIARQNFLAHLKGATRGANGAEAHPLSQVKVKKNYKQF